MYMSGIMLLRHWITEKSIYQQQTRWFLACHRQQKLHSCLKRVRESLHGPVIRRDLWPLHSDLTPRAFYWWGSFKVKMYKTDCHTLEKIRNNIGHEIQQFTGKRTRESIVFRSCTECIRSGGQPFSTCCSTGEFLLDFLKVIFTANLFLASFTECWTFRDCVRRNTRGTSGGRLTNNKKHPVQVARVWIRSLFSHGEVKTAWNWVLYSPLLWSLVVARWNHDFNNCLLLDLERLCWLKIQWFIRKSYQWIGIVVI
jgi:hypothetical protein